jgi:hypothetical protein
MGMFDFEELVADMLSISDEQREDDSILEVKFYEAFGIEMEQGYELSKRLLLHTPKVSAGLTGKNYHAFVSKSEPIMLMKAEAQI